MWTNLGSAGIGGRGNYGGLSPVGAGQLAITDGADSFGNSTTSTHIFTISSGMFSAGPAMIGNRAGHAQGTLPDGRVLVADGFNTATTTVSTVELLTATSPTATSAVSRINHGACGTFDIPLPLICPSGVECRSTGGSYTMVVTFNQTVTSVSGATVTCGTGTAGTPTFSGTDVSVPLTGVTDQQNITVQINGVNGTGTATVPMGILIGDTNGNRAVNAGDLAQTKARSGQTVDATNFRSDVNANCAINAGDVAIIKTDSGHGISDCCP
jgi:hypothetical protein